jgi:hypothetical protein
MPALLTKGEYLQEKTSYLISTYKNCVGRSYRISAKMLTEWPKVAESCLGAT